MRFEKGHKAATRRHIIDVASKCFRRDGVSAAGIAGIMAEAGLTNGAFYPHFESKEALVREALASALADQQHGLDEDQRKGLDLEGAIRRYLNRAHLDDPAVGCPSAALLPEIARQALPTRQDVRGRAEELRCRRWPRCFRMPIPQRASAARPPSSASWWELSSSREPCPTPAQAEQILEGGVEAALRLADTPSPQ